MKSEVMLEQSVLGWKEYELEVMRDGDGNQVVVCSIENLDPMGIHTGDSITVAPAQTLTDKEYQIMRNGSIAVLREIGVDELHEGIAQTGIVAIINGKVAHCVLLELLTEHGAGTMVRQDD